MTILRTAPMATSENEQLRMLELARQGFHCSEILVAMGLTRRGTENPDLIRAVSGLAGGIGFSGEVCGALTGGACLLALYSGRGASEEVEDPRMRMMIQDLMDWFSAKYGDVRGGIRCREITGDDPANVASRCPRIVWAVYAKAKSLLEEHGFSEGVPLKTCGPMSGKRSACPVACG
jgi:C_GCAxxG_C_C family probable redox protein